MPLNISPLAPGGFESLDCLPLGACYDACLTTQTKDNQCGQVGHQVQWQQRPEQNAGHVFHKGPHHVAVAMEDGKIAVPPARGGAAYVLHHRCRHIARRVPGQTQAKAQVNVFHIAEIALVEATGRHEGCAPVECGGSARGKYFTLNEVAGLLGFSVSFAPGHAAPVVAVANAIEQGGVFVAQLA